MKHRKLTDLISLVVFGIFAVCILLVLLTGAEAYRNMVNRGDAYYHRRTATQYIATRVRQSDMDQGIRVAEFSGLDCLELREEIQGEVYLTRVYCYEGYLRELFTGENGQVSPESGEKILEAREITLSLEADILRANITLPDGCVQELVLYLRSKGGTGA